MATRSSSRAVVRSELAIPKRESGRALSAMSYLSRVRRRTWMPPWRGQPPQSTPSGGILEARQSGERSVEHCRPAAGTRRGSQRERAQWARGSPKAADHGIDLLDGGHRGFARQRGGLLLRLRREAATYYTKTYTNQIGIPGISFADSGDSGALVLDASNAEPVGLFFSRAAPVRGPPASASPTRFKMF